MLGNADQCINGEELRLRSLRYAAKSSGISGSGGSCSQNAAPMPAAIATTTPTPMPLRLAIAPGVQVQEFAPRLRAVRDERGIGPLAILAPR